MNLAEKNPFLLFAIISIFGYVFIADFVGAVMGLTPMKLVCAVCTLLFGLIGLASCYRSVRYKQYLWIPFVMLIVYVLVFRNLQSLTYFYTLIFAFFFIQMPSKTLKLLDAIFVFQFCLVLIEVLTQSLFYTEVTIGIFGAKELEQRTDLFEISGFRAKGMFTGCLEATGFTIYYSFLNRNNYRKSIFAFIMALMLNGRMAMIMTFFIFAYNTYIRLRERKISAQAIKVFTSVLILLLAIVFLSLSSYSQRMMHLLNVFNPETADFIGRIDSYVLAANEYFLNYSIPQKIYGSTYELVRVIGTWEKEMAAESDVLGILLEIGAIGLFFMMYYVYKAYKRVDQKIFEPHYISLRLVLLLTIVCMIQYRHVGGNVRGTLFWFLLLTSYICNIKRVKTDYALIATSKK